MRSAQASIVKIDDKRYRVFVEAGRDLNTGKRKRITKTVRGSRKEAERVKTKLLAEVGETTVARQTMTLEQFFQDLYLPDAKVRLRKTTVAGYEKHYNLSIRDTLGSYHIAEIKPLTITRMLASIDGEAKKFEAFKLLRQVLNKATRWGIIDQNPCNNVDVPKKPRYQPETLSQSEAVAYIKLFKGHTLEAVVLIAIGGGLRRSEIAALDWADISKDGAITIDNAVTVVNGKAHEDTTKTEFSKRTVHLPGSITRRLNKIRESDDTPIAHEANGKRMNPDRISRLYSEKLEDLPENVKSIPLKNLRHTSLTLALESGTDLLAVSRRAGHSNVGITSAYYLRPSEQVDIDAAKSLDGFLTVSER